MLRAAQATARVLMAFEATTADLGVADIAAQTGYGRSHVSKLLSTLRAEGLVIQLPSRKYRISQRMFALGNQFVRVSPLAGPALPVMQALSVATGHSVTLAVREGHEIFHLMAVDGPAFPECRWRVGQKISHHTSAAARVLLAFMPARHVAILLRARGLPRMTERTITDRETFRAALRATRRWGAAFTASEGVQGLAGLAVPVFDHSGEVPAALAVLAPEPVMTDPLRDALCAKMRQSARDLSTELGSQSYPY